jgi:hypothetical protein
VFVTLLTALLLVPPLAPGIGAGNGANDTPPPAVLAGARTVSVRDANGGIQRLTSIPSTSAFARYGGGAAATCTFTADRDDFVLSDGDRVPRGTVVTSTYHFVEGLAVAFDLPPAELPADVADLPSSGTLEMGMRTFTVFCDRAFYDVNQITVIQVPIVDPLFDPRSQLDRLRNALQLDRPVVFDNPVVDTYGGLITRYPTWLAIEPDTWRTQRGAPIVYRGATLLLIAQPREMEFVVDFSPDPDKPSPPFRGIVSCVPDEAARSGSGALPALPVMADQSEPGVNGACTWTPPGPGEVTITARITYSITFWANGFTEPADDYLWTSTPTTYATGELVAVNTKP